MSNYGVDKLFVDEAHYYKNLFLYTKMNNVSGIAQVEAQKSSDLFMKCRYLDEITGSKGVVFATGTPVSNSMVELYTMQRYLQYETLKKMGLEHFDNWASTFGETVTAMELAPEGNGFRIKTRFAKFHNLPELMDIFKEIADIQTEKMLNLPVPEAEFHNIALPPSPVQKEMIQDLADRAQAVRNKEVDPSQDNMLLITNDGKKIALDQRLANNMLDDFKDSKISRCSEEIFKNWEDTKENKLTQLVFCDLSTPKSFKDFDNFDEEYLFTDVYNDLKRKLIQKGIPNNEIAFIHQFDSEIKKKEVFDKVRKGEVRILMGSTNKMGAGTNCQDKIMAIHHLDCPWRPADLTQRNGRGIRQGNQNEKIDIYTYVTEESFDAYLFQMLKRKQNFISQLSSDKMVDRSAEDIDEVALRFSEIMGLASGDKRIMEKTELDTEVSKLKLLRQSYLNQVYDLEDRINKFYPQEINRLDNLISAMEEDSIIYYDNNKNDEFTKMTINGIEYTEKEQAGKALIESCKKKSNSNHEVIGEYKGFKMELSFNTIDREFEISLRNKTFYTTKLGTDVYGNIIRIENALKGIDKKLPNYKQQLDDTYKQLENAKIEVSKEFPQEEELKNKMERLAELNAELNLNEKEESVEDFEEDKDISDDNEKDKDRPNKNYER